MKARVRTGRRSAGGGHIQEHHALLGDVARSAQGASGLIRDLAPRAAIRTTATLRMRRVRASSATVSKISQFLCAAPLVVRIIISCRELPSDSAERREA